MRWFMLVFMVGCGSAATSGGEKDAGSDGPCTLQEIAQRQSCQICISMHSTESSESIAETCKADCDTNWNCQGVNGDQ